MVRSIFTVFFSEACCLLGHAQVSAQTWDGSSCPSRHCCHRNGPSWYPAKRPTSWMSNLMQAQNRVMQTQNNGERAKVATRQQRALCGVQVGVRCGNQVGYSSLPKSTAPEAGCFDSTFCAVPRITL